MDSRELRIPGYMFYCVLVAALGSFATGWVIGSANVPGEVTHNCENGNAHIYDPKFPDCLPMNTSLWGFAVSAFCVGGLVGGITGGRVQTKLGRKKAIIVNTFGWFIGAIIIGCSVHPAMFIIGRILCGLSCGLGSLCIPTYIGEVSTIKARGAMGACHQFFIVVGILLSSVIGLPTASVPFWRINYAIVGIPALFQFFLMNTCVESPRWLISVSRIDEARHALKKLRGSAAHIDSELYEIVEGQMGQAAATSILNNPESKVTSFKEKSMDADCSVSEEDALKSPGANAVAPTSEESRREQLSLIGIFVDPIIRRITAVVLSLHFIQQWSGMNAVMFYSTMIFSSAFDADMSKYMAIATTGVNFVATMASVILIDRMGRRALLMLSQAGCCLFSVLLVIGYRVDLPALLVVSVFLYVASFAIGIGPIPWLTTSEVTPTYASSSVGAAATCMNWAMNFVIGQVFPLIFEAISGFSFCIFAGVCFAAFVFTFFFVPETKNRSIENIVRGFEKGHFIHSKQISAES